MPQENSDWKIRISKVLDLEISTGYEDRAATCGLEAFVRLQCASLAKHVLGYGASSPADRECQVERLRAALGSDVAPSVLPSHESNIDLHAPITSAQGIGAKRAALLEKLGLRTIEDLMMLFPRRLEDRTQATTIGTLQEGMEVSVRGQVHSIQKVRSHRRMSLTKASIGDGTGFLSAVWFNQPWIADQLKRGMSIDVFGRIERSYGELQMKSPVWESASAGVEVGRWVPVYPATEGITSRSIRTLIHKNLDLYLPGIRESLSEDLRRRFKLMPQRTAVEMIHRPQDPQAFQRARRSLAFEEFFLLQLGLLRTSRTESGRAHTFSRGLLDSFLAGLPLR